MNENPYESPKYVLETDASGSPFGEIVYYRTDSRRLSYAEFWRLSRNTFEFVIAAIFKTLRIPLPATFAFASAVSSRPVDPNQFPESAVRQLRPLADQAAECGFQFGLAYVLPSVGAVDSCALSYHADEGSTVATIVYVRAWTARGTNEQVAFSLLSRLTDGRVVATSGAKRQLNAPPEYLVEYLPGQTFREVYERHRERLVEHTSAVVRARGPAEVLAAVQDFERRTLEFQHTRGVYVVATPREMEAFSRLSQQPAPTNPPKSTAFQGLEFLCLFTLGVGLFFFGSRLPVGFGAHPPLVAMILACAVGGLTLIWLYRALQNRKNRQRNADQP